MINVITKTILGDLLTPTSTYLKIRKMSSASILLENSDRNNIEDSRSYIGFEPIAHFKVANRNVELEYPNGEKIFAEIDDCKIDEVLSNFIGCFNNRSSEIISTNGFFGFSKYDSYSCFSENFVSKDTLGCPDMYYILFRFVFIFDDFKNDLTIIENIPENNHSIMDEMIDFLNHLHATSTRFEITETGESSISDNELIEMIEQVKENCRSKELTKLVLSRQFFYGYSGDDFNVYRELRSLNPSSFTFYFNFGDFKIIGTSPIGYCTIKKNKISIENIRSFRRTNEIKDHNLILMNPKENKEHLNQIKLLQLELEQICKDVEIDYFRKLHLYSNRIRLTSRISGTLICDTLSCFPFMRIFPAAGTTGIPRQKAVKLIEKIEKHKREIYGSCIGLIGFHKNINLAITRLNVLSFEDRLYYHSNISVDEYSNIEEKLNEERKRLDFMREIIIKAQYLT